MKKQRKKNQQELEQVLIAWTSGALIALPNFGPQEASANKKTLLEKSVHK